MKYIRETNYDTYILGQFINEYESWLVVDQRVVYHSTLNSIENDKGVTFFIDVPSGTSKTFLINLLLSKVCQKKNIALAVASSGIAATHLDGGRTAHSIRQLIISVLGTKLSVILQSSSIVLNQQGLLHIIFY